METNAVKEYLVRKKIFFLCLLEKPRQDKNLFYWHDEPKEPNKKGPLLYVLHESQFSSVSTVSTGHPSLDSLEEALFYPITPLIFPLIPFS
jgi:hypothetical protein